MFGAFERAIAGRYLRARRSERYVSIIAVFSLVGIALGVFALIASMSVMNGFRHDLLERVLGLNGHLSVLGQGQSLTDYAAITARIRQVPGVTSAMPIIERQALFTSARGGAAGGMVRGVRPEDIRHYDAVANNLVAGSLGDFQGDGVIAIGIRLAEDFGLAIGDTLSVVSPQGQATVVGTIPRIRAFRVVAIFQMGMAQYDRSYVFIPLQAAQAFYNLGDAVTQISVMTSTPENVRATGYGIHAALEGFPVRLLDWQAQNSAFAQTINVQRNVLFILLMLIIIVAAFNVISSMIMLVKDKTRDIAVLRTVGATQGAIMRIFLMIGSSVGIAGTIIGTILGILFGIYIEQIRAAVEWVTGTNVFNPEVYFLTRMPVRMEWQEVVVVTVTALVICLLATIQPAWRAAKTDPVEALRNE